MQNQQLTKGDGKNSRQSPENDRLMTPSQLAEMLSLPLASIYDMRYRGTGPRAIKLTGKALRFRLSDVESWLKERETASTAQNA
jgi:predicted DNA-binding transcriptional regulator AlpA